MAASWLPTRNNPTELNSMVAGTTYPHRVYMDLDDEHTEELGLGAVRLGKPWNGYEVPITTASEFRRFIAAWQHNDPNGQWVADGVTEDGGVLTFDDGERDEPDQWTAIGTDAAGNALYAIDGWLWWKEPTDLNPFWT